MSCISKKNKKNFVCEEFRDLFLNKVYHVKNLWVILKKSAEIDPIFTKLTNLLITEQNLDEQLSDKRHEIMMLLCLVPC